MSEWLRLIIFVTFGLFIGIIDFKIQKIPDILLLIMLGLLLCVDSFGNFNMMPYRLLAGFGSYWMFYAVYRIKGGLGYGDVKYAGVIGYYLGPELIIIGFTLAVLFGLGYWGLGNLMFRWGKEKRFPFGPWLGCGAAAAGFFHRVMS